jgi:uncharacterized protein YceK
MMKQLSSVILGCLLLAFISGCMSIMATGSRFDGSPSPQERPYFGTRTEAMFIRSCFTGRTMTPGWGPARTPTSFAGYAIGTISVIDLPITVVTDTLFLPYDTYSSHKQKQREQSVLQDKEAERLQWQRENANK